MVGPRTRAGAPSPGTALFTSSLLASQLNLSTTPLYFEDAMLERHGHTHCWRGWEVTQSLVCRSKNFETIPCYRIRERYNPSTSAFMRWVTVVLEVPLPV